MSYPYPPGQQGAYYTQQPGANYGSPPAGTTVHYISTGQPYPGQGGPPPQATTAKDPTLLLTPTMAKHNRAWSTAKLEVLHSKSCKWRGQLWHVPVNIRRSISADSVIITDTSKLRPRMTVSAHSCVQVLCAQLAVGAAWNAAMVSAKKTGFPQDEIF